MRVFISWSGEPSKSIAHALRRWLPTVVQHAEPWIPDEDIQSGTRWSDKVVKTLDQTDFAIVCVTASNQHQPWLMFEAGALAERLGAGRIVPLCIDLTPADVTGPLAAFQGRRLDESGMKQLVQEMMVLRDKPPPEAQIDTLFQALWPALESQVKEAELQSPTPHPSQRSQEEMLEELIDRVRRLERTQSREVSGTASVGLGAVTADAAGGQDAVRFIEGEPPSPSRRRDARPSEPES